MSDIVERLRSRAWEHRHHRDYRDEAADEIEHLNLMLTSADELIKALRKLVEWQPIETAPRDLSPILIAYRSGEGPKVREARWSFGRASWEMAVTYVEDGSSDLLGWLPLPPPPGGKDE